MSPAIIALITFGCTFGGALLGNLLHKALPPSNVTQESQDVVRLGIGLVATMTALLLGLVTASAKEAFDSQDAAIKTSATNILTLDRHLDRYGFETHPIRAQLLEVVAARIQATWGQSRARFTAEETTAFAEGIQQRILALAPATEAQRWHKAQALQLAEEVLRTRWRVMEGASGSTSTPFLTVVISWLTITLLSFGLFAPRNATVLASLFVVSVSVAAAVYLILELDNPFSGSIMISSGPLRFALTHLGR